MEMFGLTHIYHGDGKGKTTAAIGLAIRAAGSGKKVLFTQFMKGSVTSELAILEKVENIRVLRSSKDFGFFYQMSEEDKKEICKEQNRILDEIKKAIEEGTCDVIVFDEITYAYRYQLLDREKMEQLFDNSDLVEKIVTGRDPDVFFLERADYITEMKKQRHPFDKGIPARIGIEK